VDALEFQSSLVDATALMKAAFDSDIGADNDTLRVQGGSYQWFEVTKIDKAREKTFLLTHHSLPALGPRCRGGRR
jgi:hypothetical protein